MQKVQIVLVVRQRTHRLKMGELLPFLRVQSGLNFSDDIRWQNNPAPSTFQSWRNTTAIIFRGQGTRLSQLEKEAWNPRVIVMFQKCNKYNLFISTFPSYFFFGGGALVLGPLPYDKHNLNFAWKALRWIRSASTLTSFLDRDWIFLEIRQTIHEAQKLGSGCCCFTTTFAVFFNLVGIACPAMTSPSFESHNEVSLHSGNLTHDCLNAMVALEPLLWQVFLRFCKNIIARSF